MYEPWSWTLQYCFEDKAVNPCELILACGLSRGKRSYNINLSSAEDGAWSSGDRVEIGGQDSRYGEDDLPNVSGESDKSSQVLSWEQMGFSPLFRFACWCQAITTATQAIAHGLLTLRQ